MENFRLDLTEHNPQADMRLGRHVNHDPRSRGYSGAANAAINSIMWTRRSPIFDQGNLGSCTGNAASGIVATDSKWRNGRVDCTEPDAVRIYSRATQIDSYKGTYPPTDTGSDGLSVMKVLKEQGYVKAYNHAFSFNAVATALQTTPVICGITWLEDCYYPNADGLVSYSGQADGGHEFVVRGLDMSNRLVICDNSWADSWGAAGSFKFTFDDFTKAMKNNGDVTIPVWWNTP